MALASVLQHHFLKCGMGIIVVHILLHDFRYTHLNYISLTAMIIISLVHFVKSWSDKEFSRVLPPDVMVIVTSQCIFLKLSNSVSGILTSFSAQLYTCVIHVEMT